MLLRLFQTLREWDRFEVDQIRKRETFMTTPGTSNGRPGWNSTTGLRPVTMLSIAINSDIVVPRPDPILTIRHPFQPAHQSRYHGGEIADVEKFPAH